MTNDTRIPEIALEPMPAPLLAELFSSGIVVIPEEYEVAVPKPKTGEKPAGIPQQKSIEATPSPAPLPARAIEVPVAAALNWLGNFGKQVLVVVKDPTALHINEVDLELLTKILGSVKLSMADIALVNAATHPLEYYSLNEKLPASVAFYFGIQPVEIGAPIKFPAFQVQKWNSTTFLFAPPLGELNKNTPDATALKKELWGALKKIFG